MNIEEHFEPEIIGSTDRAPECEVNVAVEVDRLRACEGYFLRGYRAKSLLRNDNFSVVLMVLRRGTHIREHRSEHPMALVSLLGRLRVGFGDVSRVLSPRNVGAIPVGVLHELEAMDDCDILLIVDRSLRSRFALAQEVLA